MKKLMFLMTMLMTNSLLATNVYAASTELTWTDYEKYYDVNEGNNSRGGFKGLLDKHFGEHFAELAAKLPEKQTLKIEITDVDLAGHVRVASMNSMRIVKQGYPPRINLTYQLLDESGKEIKADSVVIRDTGYMTSQPLKYRNKMFGHEKNMLDDWFKKTFKEFVITE